MALRVASLLLSAVACSCSVAVKRADVTPVEKVIDLLKNLQHKVEQEGKTDAANYDKFACFCKEQADNKQYAIEKSEEKIAALSAKESALSSEIAELTSEITALQASIKALKDTIKSNAEARTAEHKVYQASEADLSAAIKALEDATAALKDAKSQQKDAKVDFVQVRALVGRVLSAVSKVPSRSSSRSTEALLQLGSVAVANQDPAAYEYQSNDIIATLQELLVTFKENKKQLDVDEFDNQAAFDTRALDLTNQKKFQTKDKDQKTKVMEAKTAELNQVTADKTLETKEKTADQAFLAVVVSECQTKAGLWDQRSKTRSEELTAIAEALDLLTNKVSEAFKANSKLSGIQTASKPKADKVKASAKDSKTTKVAAKVAAPSKPAKAAAPQKKAQKKALSFLQLRSASDSLAQKEAEIGSKAADTLMAASGRLHSAVLATVAARISASEDHFVKVRAIIKDLLAKLQADKESEATQKAFCDKAMSEGVNARDAAKAKIEQLHATKSALQAEKAQLLAEVAALSGSIAELKKALLEAGELRAKDSAQNAETVATATEGKSAVTLAIKVLNDFYNKDSFLQLSSGYVPEDADREGKSFKDLAPEVFQGNYDGHTKSSGGIIGLLEVIESDFERTITTVTADEAEAAAAFSAFAADTESEIEAKDGDIATKNARISVVKDELTSTKDQLGEQESLLAAAEAALLDLKAQCVDGEESYEERVAKRKAEIESLKEAKAILESWKN